MSEPRSIPLPTAPSQGISARRIRFVTQLPAGTRARNKFRQPRVCHAIEEPVELANLPRDRPWPEPTDGLLVLHMPRNAPADWQRFGETWMTPADHPEAVQPITLQGKGRTMYWRPGRALIVGDRQQKGSKKGPPPAGMPEDVLAALVDFAFHEGELRSLESAIKIGETSMNEDVGRAFKIRFRDRTAWPHFAAMTEHFGRLRVVYTLLEPRLASAPRTLPGISQRWVERLCELAHIEDRLEDASNRIENGEFLYGEANDRIADYKGYHLGHMLEIVIILLLVLEVAISSVDTYGHIVLDHQSQEADDDE